MQDSNKKNNLNILSLTIRPTDNFIVASTERLGGSSLSVQVFKENNTSYKWVGKCSERSANYRKLYDEDGGPYYNEYREWLGIAINRLLGIHIPDAVLSHQIPLQTDNGYRNYTCEILS